MKKILLLTLLAAVALSVGASVKKTNLRILYVGGHSDLETFATDYDSVANAKSIVVRTAAFERLLKEYFTTVKTVDAKDYDYHMSYDYDVTVLDGQPEPLEPRQNIMDGQRFVKRIEAKYFPDDFDRPVLTIAELGKTIGGRLGLKTDWYCLCLDQWAFGMRTTHPIFKGPYKVGITLVDKPTPQGAKEFAPFVGEELPDITPMWQVNTKGYVTHPGYKIGMVSRPWGLEDSPEAEWISSGLCTKSIDAMALGRHANFFHWGFAGGPDDMTEEAKPLFVNAIIYIAKFAGQHLIARKYNEGIPTRIVAKENCYRITQQCYDDYVKSISAFNEQMRGHSDSIKAVVAAGGQVGQHEAFYLQWQPQPIPSREQFLQQMAGPLYSQFGNDEAAYQKYYTDNEPYFYSRFDSYSLILDDDAKSLGIPNNDLRLIKKAIEIWKDGSDPAKGRRILERYTLLRYDNPDPYAAWVKKYEKKLFFTESGGWYWLVNSQDVNQEGNDYSVLNYWKAPEQKVPEIEGNTDQQNPVLVSALLNDTPSGNDKELVVRIKIHPTYHIYGYVAEQDPYIATSFDIQLPEGWEKVGDMKIPPFKTTGQYGTTIYEGDVTFRQRIKGSGHGEVKLNVNYQCCDSHACFPPRDVAFSFQL